MGKITTFEATKAVVRRNTEEAEHAPPPEPIRGYFADSWVESVFFRIAVGFERARRLAVAAPAREVESPGGRRCSICWSAGGLLLGFFSAMNYFAHIGLLMNASDSF